MGPGALHCYFVFRATWRQCAKSSTVLVGRGTRPAVETLPSFENKHATYPCAKPHVDTSLHCFTIRCYVYSLHRTFLDNTWTLLLSLLPYMKDGVGICLFFRIQVDIKRQQPYKWCSALGSFRVPVAKLQASMQAQPWSP
ncbi:hypothetical protein TRVL_02990 [Trypanosoma vivax]|nr:hypothetical protein TRVL_02990 [Trypanosoma vivax]